MKKVITLGLMSLLTLTSFSQKLDYDTDSKWFFGINAGAAWNTTDVKNKTNLGWGLTLGRAFNYNYGKKLSFDLRLRYLRANWYGQDYRATNVTGNPGYDPLGNVAEVYDTVGYTINNFQADVHEFGLEFVLHFNSLRERSGWDPYIFGGAHLSWNQTFGDLVYPVDEFGFDTTVVGYDYSQYGMSKQEWNSMSDGIFDKPLDGSFENKFNVDFMPSLGIGLAYQVSPRFAVGIEHKTTFTLKNNFDGYADESKKWGMFDNDLYHYTSAILKFHLRRKVERPEVITDPNPVVNNAVESDCLEPVIKRQSPRSSPMTVYSPNLVLGALVSNVSGRDNIQFTVNGNASTNFLYNGNNDKFESNLLLIPGQNTIIITAVNECGTVSETISLMYVDCTAPVLNFTNPTTNGISVDQPNFVVSAKIDGASSVVYEINGVNSSNFSFAQTTGDFASNTVLREGSNTIKIIATNDCGSTEETIIIQYSQCAEPYISISGGNTVSADNASYVVNASVSNVVSKSNISFKVNGNSIDFIYNPSTDKFQSNVALRLGANTLVITATNDCGTVTQSQTVTYTPCLKPTVTITAPSNGASSSNSQYTVSAIIANISSHSQVSVSVNGTAQSGGSYNPSTQTYTNTVSLVEGLNTIAVVATTNCGTDSKTVTIRRNVIVVEEEKIQICHVDVSSREKQTILIPVSDWAMHQAHGDVLGECKEEEVVEGRKITICHTDQRTRTSEEMVISLQDWPAHQAHGDVLGPCPEEEEVEEQLITICHTDPTTRISEKLIIPLSDWAAHQAHGDVIGPCPVEEVEEKITICHKPPGNPSNTQEIEIPLSAWPAHQAHGDVLGPCPEEEVEEKITICHKPPGNPSNTQEIEIPLSAWPAHQAHGDVLGPCPEEEVEEKITICHKPPGNPSNTQEIEIPLSAWPAHQAHGDVLGPCPEEEVEEKITICHKPPGNPSNTQEIEIPLSAWPAHQAHGDVLGPCPVSEDEGEDGIGIEDTNEGSRPGSESQIITICHKPPGNPSNTQELEIPLSAWPAHQAHGDVLGPCPEEEEAEEQKITICHKPPGNPSNTQEIEIPLSAWPAHQAHGDVLGPCPESEEEESGEDGVGVEGTNEGSRPGSESEESEEGSDGEEQDDRKPKEKEKPSKKKPKEPVKKPGGE